MSRYSFFKKVSPEKVEHNSLSSSSYLDVLLGPVCRVLLQTVSDGVPEGEGPDGLG